MCRRQIEFLFFFSKTQQDTQRGNVDEEIAELNDESIAIKSVAAGGGAAVDRFSGTIEVMGVMSVGVVSVELA